MQREQFEVVINGGGMVGAALACGLAREGFSVAVIDHLIPQAFVEGQAPDIRISALGAGSVNILKALDIWPQILERRCTPYRHLETWEWQTARTIFSAEMLGLPELGYMVENSVLQRVLWERMQQQNIALYCPNSLIDWRGKAGRWLLTLADGHEISARLIIGADGANSKVRQLAKIGIQGWDYAQACMLISVRTQQAPGDSTWQQFTPQGPRAFLPLFDNYASLVWYDSPQRIQQLTQLSVQQLTDEIAQHFPQRLGQVEILQRGAFPLTRRHAKRYFLPGIALVGDAAHTINPLAGQGVNLGYRDIDQLINVLVDGRALGEQWWESSVLSRYQRKRYTDNLLMQNGMDLFYFAFSNQSPPLRVFRNLGLMVAERAGWLKRQALAYALGLHHTDKR